MPRSDTRWGHPADVWAAAVDQARAELVQRARSGRTITYSELCAAVTAAGLQPRSWGLMALVDEACAPEDAEHRIVLASLVVRADTGMPGRGYFEWAARSGADVSDPEAYWRGRTEAVYAAYAGGSR
jgi:hypothetical protein